jgi:hypothetical protein
MNGNQFRFGQSVKAQTDRARLLESGFRPWGQMNLKLFRDGKIIHEEDFLNGVTDGGINELLDVYFRNQTQHASWYLGIIDNSGYTGVAAGDTMASHTGWNEFTNYSGTNRIQWSPAAAAAKAISNSSTSDFAITGTGTLKGIFVTNTQAHSPGNTGELWATALFAATIAVVNGDTLKITYTVNGS